MKVTEISKYKAKLNGHTVRLRPVTTKTIRGGKFYIRVYDNHSELVRIIGNSFASDAKHMRDLGSYRGKVKIGAMRRGFGGGLRRDDYYLSDLGCHDVKHGRCGAALFEFTNDTWNLLKSTNKAECHLLMDYGDTTWIYD